MSKITALEEHTLWRFIAKRIHPQYDRRTIVSNSTDLIDHSLSYEENKRIIMEALHTYIDKSLSADKEHTEHMKEQLREHNKRSILRALRLSAKTNQPIDNALLSECGYLQP